MIHGIDTSFIVATELAAHSRHGPSRTLLQQLIRNGDQLAIAPQVLAEFIHIVTDPRRCTAPLDITTAVDRAESLWNLAQVAQIFPNAAAASQFFAWMRQFRLGRKRLLDTLLAATYWSAGIRSIVTLNRSDFAVFQVFGILEP